jgi:hypothetical protein
MHALHDEIVGTKGLGAEPLALGRLERAVFAEGSAQLPQGDVLFALTTRRLVVAVARVEAPGNERCDQGDEGKAGVIGDGSPQGSAQVAAMTSGWSRQVPLAHCVSLWR